MNVQASVNYTIGQLGFRTFGVGEAVGVDDPDGWAEDADKSRKFRCGESFQTMQQRPIPDMEPPVAEVIVRPVDTRAERKRFIQLPWRIYRDDPCWMPPLVMSQEELLGFRPHPFYERSKSRSFLATRGGRDVGRITAIVNAGHIERYKEQRGFFGFFECDDDEAAARGLFDAAKEWLHGQGMTSIRGPANPSLNYECGLLIEGFETPPFFMMTHNRPWYGKLVEANGFGKIEDLYAFWGEISMLNNLDSKLATMVEGVKERFGVRVRPLDRNRFDEEVRMFLDIYNSSLSGTWGFVPLSSSEVKHMAESLRHLIVPELSLVAEVNGKPIGTVFCLLDYNPRIKAINGRLFPSASFGCSGIRRASSECGRSARMSFPSTRPGAWGSSSWVRSSSRCSTGG